MSGEPPRSRAAAGGDDPLEGLVRCPACRHATLEGAGDGRRCPSCGVRFSAADGVLDLLASEMPAPGLAQVAMESALVARIYDSWLWRRSPWAALALGISAEREQALVLEAAGLAGDETVLDLACGPGFYTRPLAERLPAGRVIGLDVSRAMLVLARRRLSREGQRNVGFVRGSALDLPFPEASFDVATCCGALHLFPDPLAAVSEVRRVLRVGGRFAVATVRRLEGPVTSILEWLGIRPFTVLRLEAMLAAAGFGAVCMHHARGAWLIASAEAL